MAALLTIFILFMFFYIETENLLKSWIPENCDASVSMYVCDTVVP